METAVEWKSVEWTEKSVVDKAREMFQLSPTSDERRCGSDGWWKAVPHLWDGDRKRPL